MNRSLFEQIKKYLELKKKRQTWKKIVMSMAVMVVFVTTYLLVLPALTMTAKSSGSNETQTTIDFTDYITAANVSKLVNGTWTPATEFTEGDHVKVTIEYKLPAGTISSEKGQTITYQLPKGVTPTKTETGDVTQGSKKVGTYEITADGKVTIKFNDEFSNGDAFTGDIQFEGTLSRTGDADQEQIQFGGESNNITVKKDTEKYDITTKKEAQLISDDKIQYTINVSSENGTGGNTVKIEDIFQNGTAVGSYDKESFKVYKKDANGNKTQISGKTPTFSEDANGNQSFVIRDLEALNAGESYIVEYQADTKIKSDDGSGQVTNKAGAQTGKKEKWDQKTMEVSKAMVQKWGNYDSEKGLIHWIVKINQSKKDISGYTFTDDLPEDLVGDAVIKDSSNYQIGKASVDGKTISYTFADGSKDSYTIEYWTKAPEKGGSVSNKAVIQKGDTQYHAGASIDVKHRNWQLEKSYNGTETKDDQTYYKWNSAVTLPDGKMGEFTYTDTIKQAESQAGTSTPGENTHYAIASKLQAQLEQLKIKLSIDGEDKEVGYTNDYVDFQIKYYDKDGKEISVDDTTSKVRKFEIKVTPKKVYEEISGTWMTLNYNTIVDLSGMTQGDTWKFVNHAEIPDHKKDAEHSYTNEYTLEKQNGVKEGDYITYKNEAVSINYDETKGILYYRILLRTKASDDEEITLTDTLPEGATLVKDSITGAFYGNDYWCPSSFGNYDFAKDQKITYTTDGQKVIMKIAKGYNSCGKIGGDSPGGNIIAVAYQISVKGDEYWKNLANDHKDYTNKVEWNGNRTQQTTTVEKNIEEVQKSAEQLKDDNGKLLNAVKYKVVINPAAKDLLKDSEQLTLTDTMEVPDGVDAYLDLSQIKLYQLDASKDDQLGEEIPAERYQVSYDQKTHKMTLQIPDELACVLVYRYDIDAGNKKEPQLSNKVSLSGEYESKNETKVETSSSSATVKKGKLVIYKVDGENYKKLLSGAEFKLEYWDGENNKWVTQAENLKTDDDGQITLDSVSADTEHQLRADSLYRLTETKAPEGYQIAQKGTCFIYKGYQSDGSVLSDDKVYQNAKASASGVQKSDINFYGSVGGILYIPNDYTRVSVKKVWTDSSNKTTDPASDAVKVQLYRQKTKLDGYTVKLKVVVEGIEVKNASIVVKKNTSVTIKQDVWNRDYKITVGGIIEDLKSENGTVSYTIDNVSGDMDITIASDDQHWGNDFEFSNCQKATQYIETGTQEAIGDPVTLSSNNNWTYHWDDLIKTDDDGNPYYYTVKEVDQPKGTTVSYTNNDGIKTGEIIVTNKLEAYKLPETGGFGTTTYTKAGILFVIAGIILLYRKRKYQ